MYVLKKNPVENPFWFGSVFGRDRVTSIEYKVPVDWGL